MHTLPVTPRAVWRPDTAALLRLLPAQCVSLLCTQSVVTYTAAGPTTNGKSVLANCEVR